MKKIYLEPILHPNIDEEGKPFWPSQKKVTEKYDEMNPWTTNWYDLDKGPMRYRIRARRAKLAKLSELYPDKTAADKKREEFLSSADEPSAESAE